MRENKYGIFYDLFPRSDLAFMREGVLDPGDGRGSYSHRDKMLMLQLKAATQGDRKALIFLIKHLTGESKARMTMLKPHQMLYIREKPSFVSPAVALEILGIGGLERSSINMKEWLSIFTDDPYSDRFQQLFPDQADAWRKIEWPIVGYVEPWFLEAALTRKQCPPHARHQIEQWLANGGFQPLQYQSQVLPREAIERDDAPRRAPEECWFKPGQSGNPKGRPKGSKNKSKLVRGDFFDEVITVLEGGSKRRFTRRVAFLRKVQAKAIAEQDHEVMRLLLDRHIAMSKLQATVPYDKLKTVTVSIGGIHPNSLEGAIHVLGGGELLYANKSTARMLLEPWIIEMGFANLGERRLSIKEQRIVLACARHPRRTFWPEWWETSLRTRG